METCCHSDSSESPSAYTAVKNHRNNNNNINNNNNNNKSVDFAVPADPRIKLKECEKTDKYLDLARELKKKLWNMKVTIIPIVIDAFGTITKGLLKGREDLEVDGRVETIQTTTLLKMAGILRRVLETWGDLLSLNERSSAYADVKNSNE